MSKKEEAINTLRTLIPHLEIAKNIASMRTDDSIPMVGILSVSPDDSGFVVAKFEMESFLKDLKYAIDYNMNENANS